MIVLDSGHKYQLAHLDGKETSQLTFVKRDNPTNKYPGNVGHYQGTTCQEVIRALIDRVTYLNGQQACPESEAIITLLRTSLLLFEIRAKRVHNETLPVQTLEGLERAATCTVCLHTFCTGHDSTK